ncbi:hypothetical protein [Dendronalium sp. ChiSLP03b]|uniref:hypothetical protein n=1 Tax=Dendronalium sp. ChiSLP03b TaxID=3075381 RepID=UPI002AD37BD6|nr:hypothetical protein [Dendronalium sp. ChiSLP03b]MDZ8206822.1 hypothetical protein [Dendronalium sp. ChiSLP03b]
MTNILINDLNVSGFDLLSGEESYLNEINDDELNLTYGGFTPVLAIVAISGAFSAGYEASKAAREIHDKNKGIIAWL